MDQQHRTGDRRPGVFLPTSVCQVTDQIATTATTLRACIVYTSVAARGGASVDTGGREGGRVPQAGGGELLGVSTAHSIAYHSMHCCIDS